MTMRTGLCLGLVLTLATPLTAQKVAKQSVPTEGRERTCYTFVPEGAGPETPLIILPHGSGRDGMTLAAPWEPLAKKEKIALLAPDATAREGWNLSGDGPGMLRDLVNSLASQSQIDPRRVYLFGHSSGGHHAFDLAMLESEYLAAVAVHAGALTHDQDVMIQQAARKIPIGMWSGTDDALVPIAVVRQTRDLLKTAGFVPELTEIPRHTHDYYTTAASTNQSVWTFLKQHRLTGEPKFKEYVIGK